MSRIENGSSSLTLDFVCEIADALQVTRQEVLRDVFTYTKDDSILISKKIEINIQKFSPEKQAEITNSVPITFPPIIKAGIRNFFSHQHDSFIPQ